MKHVARTIILALGLQILSPLPASSTSGLGPELPMADVLPTVLLETTAVPVDLDGDAVDEMLVVGRDGVMQLYDDLGSFRWSRSTIEIAHEGGMRPWENHSGFLGDFRGATGQWVCRSTEQGVAFLDHNGDGYRDVVASTWLSVVEPREEQRSFLVVLDGRTGRTLTMHRFEGWITNLVAAGGSHVLVTEEDGPVEEKLPPNTPGRLRLTRGTGGTTHVIRFDLDSGQTVWAHDTGVAWGQATAVAAGAFDGDGPDLAVALTGATPRPECHPEAPQGPEGNEVLVVDGATGEARWSVEAEPFVRSLVPLPGDQGEDVAVLTDGDGSSLRRLAGTDGTEVWTASLPVDADLADMTRTGDGLGVAFVVAAPIGGSVPHVGLVEGETGALAMDAIAEPDPGSLGTIRLAAVHLDAAAGRELVLRTDRQVTAVSSAGLILWQRRALLSRQVLVVSREPQGERVWIQGPIPDANTDPEPPDEMQDSVERGRYRLFGLHPRTGAAARALPLVGPMFGLTRLDVNGDGTPDRIMGGASETIFAFDGSSRRLLWSRFLAEPDLDATVRGDNAGNPILGIETEDVDADGDADLLVQGHLTVHALDRSDGRTIWTHEHGPSLGTGRWHGFALTDLTGDGVRDVVLGTSTGVNGGQSPVEGAQVVALDGTTGLPLWRHVAPYHTRAVTGLDVGDVNGDEVDDVAFSRTMFFTGGLIYGVTVLDGTTGIPIWSLDEDNGTAGGQHTTPMNAVRMIDVGGDGLADVAVLKAGSQSFDSVLRTHDGATGEDLWSVIIESQDLGSAMPSHGLYRGTLDPDEPPVLLAAAESRDGSLPFVQGVTAEGETLFTQSIGVEGAPPAGITWDLAVGDVTGDGFGDVVAPWLFGFAVIDGASAARSEPDVVGHLRDRLPTKVELFDADEDGVLEIEALRDPQGWPIHIGQVVLYDHFLRPKAVFTLDLGP